MVDVKGYAQQRDQARLVEKTPPRYLVEYYGKVYRAEVVKDNRSEMPGGMQVRLLDNTNRVVWVRNVDVKERVFC
jgi:hypothetical protein